MGEIEIGSVLKKTLKSLCCSSGWSWSYGVFWCFDKRNPMLLTLEDAYYEEQMATVVDNMLLQVHMLGEGIIGEVALTGRHKWMFSDAHNGQWNSNGSFGSPDAFQDSSDSHHLFSSGIQTIAVIYVESRGVVQFGSTQKMLESLEFLDQTNKLLQKMETINKPFELENTVSILNGETDDLNAIFASLTSPRNPFSVNLARSSNFALEIDHGRIATGHFNASDICNQLPTSSRESLVPSADKPNTLYQQDFIQSTCFKNPVSNTPCTSTWSNEDSILTSFEQSVPARSVIQDSLNVYSSKANALVQNFQGESTFTMANGTEGLVGIEKNVPFIEGKMIGNQHSAQSFLETEGKIQEIASCVQRFTEDFKLVDFTTNCSNSYTMDDLSEWFNPSPDHSLNRPGTTTNTNILKSAGSTSVTSGIVHCNVSIDIPTAYPSKSVQSSVCDAFTSNGQEKFLTVPDVENDLFDSLGVDLGCGEAGECWDDYVKPVMGGGQSAISTRMSECITDLDGGSTVGPSKGLFSQLGLEHVLNGVSSSSSVTRCSYEDHLSTSKRRKLESSSCNSNQVLSNKVSCSYENLSLVQPFYNQSSNNLIHKEYFPKSQVGLWIDDSYSINAENAVLATAKKPEKPMKVSRKRARPGETSRPRPKDRQQIQDRLKELRGIIPNGVKCSIDSLLDLTIKHMLFLQSITKYADKLKEADEPKLIGKEKGVILKDKNMSSHNGTSGATWAFEFGGQTMVCPIIVEDLSPPGQMLIEMLCEDRGFFLEIADTVRGFGLNIWKGVMEIREDKIWARFIVEANRHVTRMDIFWSLAQLLQQTTTCGTDSANQPTNVMDVRIPILDGYQQPLMPVAAFHQLG